MRKQSGHNGRTSSSVHSGSISRMIGELRTTWHLFKDPRVPIYTKAPPALIGLLYLIVPFDLVPDPLIGIGQVDDIGLLALMALVFRYLAGMSIGAMTVGDHPAPHLSEGGGRSGEQPIEVHGASDDDSFWPEGDQPQSGGGEHRSEPPRINEHKWRSRPSGTGCYCGMPVLGIIALAIVLLILVVVGPPVRDTVCWASSWINRDLRPAFCPKPPEPIDTVIFRTLQTVSKLELVNMTSADVMEVEQHGCILGPEQLLYVAKGKATVGIDLEKISKDDITVDEANKRIALHLPPPELFDAFPNVDDSRIYRYDKPLGCPNNAGTMVKTAQMQFKKKLEDLAQSEETLHIAERHLRSILALFLTEFGFTDIEVTFSTREIEGRAAPHSVEEAESPPAATDTPTSMTGTEAPMLTSEPITAEGTSP